MAGSMALHTGDVDVKEGEYQGLVLHRASRMLTAGHGGQILVSEATAALLRRDLADGLRLVDLGVYRLRDVATPERLFQVEYPGMPADGYGPLAAEAGYPANLPLQITRFFGREQEIARIGELLRPAAEEPVRLLTLTGPGGTGKTRLALSAAERLVEPFRGRVWFAALGDLTDAGLIPGAVLDALRIPRSPQQEPLEQVVQALAGQPSLVILDGCEQLVAEGVAVVATLLGRVPELTCLVTSRQVLGLAGEQQFHVSPLPAPDGPDTPERLGVYDSVRLFVDRAQAVMPHFQVTSGNAPAVAELCARLEGIPLAIELAAARAQVLTPGQMLAQLANRFELLVSRRRDVPERQRTLAGAIEWSNRLLAPELQRFFRRLSVFRGGWTPESAAEVCEEPLALDCLAQLGECSLVLAEECAHAGGMRFRMLDTLREYGEARLREAAEERAVSKRHAEHYLALAESAEPELVGPDQAEWMDRLEAELDNLRAAFAWSQEGDTDREVGARLAGALTRMWHTRGHATEGRHWLGIVLADEAGMEPALRAKALHGAGLLASSQSDFAFASSASAKCLLIFREIGDRRGIASSLCNLGLAAFEQGDHAMARDYFGECLAIAREIGFQRAIAVATGNLGSMAGVEGDYVTARAYQEEGLAVERETGNKHGIATSLFNLGVLASDQGDYTSARAYYEESLREFREIGARFGIAFALGGLALVLFEQGDFALAKANYAESLTIHRETGYKKGIGTSLSGLGFVAEAQDDYALASACYEERLAICRDIGDKLGVALSLQHLGCLALTQAEHALARSQFEEALALCLEVTDRLLAASVLAGLGRLALAQAQPQRAARLLGAAAMLREAIGTQLTPDEVAEHEQRLAELMEALGEEAFTEAWEAGRAMSMEEAAAFALEDGT
ncbi:MAG: tetratricopeptide repeat protein [Armatimonadetes bacterium]|nr:tetratricopeptide repeat protein [Armatimonadota bacterium]